MSLHHRREMFDMRHAYDHDKNGVRNRLSDSDSSESSRSDSDRSYRTQATSYSSSPAKKSPLVHYDTCEQEQKDVAQRYFHDRHLEQTPPSSTTSSVETYASTVPSEEDLPEDLPEYDVPEYTARPYQPTAIPSEPRDFSELFPSHRRLTVRHDDSTLDGNMNLRVDTEVPIHGRQRDMTLFHLRMHDLRNRECSLRRYCRDSGREVCHTVRKSQKAVAEKRPGLQRSLSNALQSMRAKPEPRNSTIPTFGNLKRNDSGYASMHSVDLDEDDRPRSSAEQDQPLSDTIKLEFSNYAQVEVKRASKRHEFEYWGIHYSWKPVTRKGGGFHDTSYQLTKAGNDKTLASIVPVPLTHRQAEDEQKKGGWIPPCSMWISDERIIRSQKDLSDVIVASGLMALVDDSVHRHFHSKESKQLLIPMPKLNMGVEYVGPKRLISEMFSRKEGSLDNRSRPSSAHGSP